MQFQKLKITTTAFTSQFFKVEIPTRV